MVEALIYDERIKYQAVKLTKEMHTRELEGKEILSLKRAHGIEPAPFPSDSDSPSELKFDLDSILYRYSAETEDSTRCDFLIFVTMYNETIKEFSDTLSGIIENMESFLESGIDLKNIVCVVMVDGMKVFKKTFSQYRSFFENYFIENELIEKFKVDDIENCRIKGGTDHDELAHCFEQTLKYQNNPKVFLNFIFCVKQNNKRKLNSHLWLFGGFCPHIQPIYIMMIDVGTVPGNGALFSLYEAMATDHRIAGCTGEIKPLDGSLFKGLVGYQIIEYKLASIFERSVESVAGFLTNLPSTFCAYRWEALQGEPLWSNYFMSILYPEKLNLVTANIYLTGDRLLSFSVFAQKNSRYLFRFVKNAVAETDVPEEFDVLLLQRRRWINGAFFGIYHIFKNYAKLMRTKHHCFRKFIYSAQIFYILLSVINNWVIVSSLYLFNVISIRTIFSLSVHGIYDFTNLIIQVYLFLLIMIFIMSYGTKPSRIKTYLKFIYIIFSVYIFMAIGNTLASMNLTTYPAWVLNTFLAVIGCFIIGSILNCSLFTIIKFMLHYVSAFPTFTNVLNIYAICNIHDVTWGSRLDFPTPEERKRADEYEHHRTRWVILWVISNVAYYAIVMVSSNDTGMYYLYVNIAIITVIYTVKFAGSILYLFQEIFCRKHLSKMKNLNEIILNRSKSIKLHKKNKKLMEKSFNMRVKKSKIVPDISIPVATEAEFSDRKLESTRNDYLKQSNSTSIPLSLTPVQDKSKIKNKKKKEKKKDKKKNKKSKKGEKNFQFFPAEEVKIEEIPEKASGNMSDIMDFYNFQADNEIIPIKGKIGDSDNDEHSDLINLGKSTENYFDFNPPEEVIVSLASGKGKVIPISKSKTKLSPKFSIKKSNTVKNHSKRAVNQIGNTSGISIQKYYENDQDSSEVLSKKQENDLSSKSSLIKLDENRKSRPLSSLLNPDFKKKLELKEMEDDIFKDDIDENGSFRAPGKEFDEFLLGLREDSGIKKPEDFSRDFDIPVKKFNPSKTINQDSDKVSIESDDLDPGFKEEKEEIDFFAPGIMSNYRYKYGMTVKRIATLTGLDAKRVREIEGGKLPELEEAEKIKKVFKETNPL